MSPRLGVVEIIISCLFGLIGIGLPVAMLVFLHIIYGSLGISVVDTRIWGCERAYARSHPQIRTSSRQILKNLIYNKVKSIEELLKKE